MNSKPKQTSVPQPTKNYIINNITNNKTEISQDKVFTANDDKMSEISDLDIDEDLEKEVEKLMADWL